VTPLSSIVLTINAGSSSIKFTAFAANLALSSLASGEIEDLGATVHGAHGLIQSASGEKTQVSFDPKLGPVDHRAAMNVILDWLRKRGYDSQVVAIGHRVVHGGPNLTAPVLIDSAVLAELRRLIPLAPLHEPHHISGIEAAIEAFPSLPEVACFDTSFHRTHPFVADTFALPRSYYDEGVRRYGFHGLSYEYITRRLRAIAPEIARGNVIIAHLGNGASMCGVHDGRSIDSTMGFTALDGLPMGTRCGQIDPGVLLFLLAHRRMSADEISDLLYKNSGLKGMSGISQDMRELEGSDSPAARDAVAYFVARIRRELGALAAVLAGVDAVVFTAGIGEHAWKVRETVLTGMEWMRIHIDAEANRANAQIISAKNSPTTVFVIPTDEELMIAEHTIKTAAVAGKEIKRASA
jgi:acetate kinase